MTDQADKSANDKSEISEEAPIVTAHRLGLADATPSYAAPPRASMSKAYPMSKTTEFRLPLVALAPVAGSKWEGVMGKRRKKRSKSKGSGLEICIVGLDEERSRARVRGPDWSFRFLLSKRAPRNWMVFFYSAARGVNRGAPRYHMLEDNQSGFVLDEDYVEIELPLEWLEDSIDKLHECAAQANKEFVAWGAKYVSCKQREKELIKKAKRKKGLK